MRRLLAAACLSSVMLAGCATTSASVDVGKAIALGWTGLDGAAKGADAAVKLGKLKGASVAVVSADLTKARDALTAATSAYYHTAGAPNVDPATEAATAAAAVAEITSILVGAK